MMHLIISMESGSLNHELLKFFEYDSSVPTNSAFYQQRSKLSVSAFRHLLKEFNLKFPLEKFRGKYYLIACDGSEFNIARNPDDPDTFHEPNGKSVSGFNMVHTISLYEVCSKRYFEFVWDHGICCMLIWPEAFTLPNTLRAASDVKFCMILSIISMWVFRIAFSYIIAVRMGMGVLGVWIAMTIDWAVRAVLFIIRYRGKRWQHKRIA